MDTGSSPLPPGTARRCTKIITSGGDAQPPRPAHDPAFGELDALLVASLGATMGVLIGLSHADVVHAFPARDGVDRVGAHAGPL